MKSELKHHTQKLFHCKALFAAISAATIPLAPNLAFAEEGYLEEIIVTSRKKEESLQDAPVTVSALSSSAIERLNINTLQDVAATVPTLKMYTIGSGNGGTIYLRGIGANTISPAFDSSVALNYDGVVSNNGRLINNGNLDMAQIEVLKGPQSLYFGKGASAGVISITSNDPTEEFEASVSVGREFEFSGTTLQGFVSGPINDELGARLAIKQVKIDEIIRNDAPGVANPERGEETLDARFTLAWDPSDNLSVNFKYSMSDYENDGPNINVQHFCVNGTPQDTTLPLLGAFGITLPNNYDCDPENHIGHYADPNPAERVSYASVPGSNNGIPFSKVDMNIARLKVDWDISDELSLTAVTSYFEMEGSSLDSYTFDSNGFVHSLARNDEENWAQEIRLSSDYEGPVNFMVGVYYQHRDTKFRQWVDGFSISYSLALIEANVDPFLPFNLIDPDVTSAIDPATGWTFDNMRDQPAEHDSYSAFASVDFDVTDRLRLTAGLRYSYEEKEAFFNIPYLHPELNHPFVVANVFGGAYPELEFFSEKITYDDDDISPELSAIYTLNEDTNLYAAYKTGFKIGGIDNNASFFPSAYASFSAGNFDSLIFESETGEGFEFGIRSTLLEGRLRLNATAFNYIYKDLQRQTFDFSELVNVTFNIGEITSRGLEVDAVYATTIEGLTLRSNLAYTDSKYSDTFVTQTNNYDLDGSRSGQSPLWAGNFGAEYITPISDALEIGINGTVNYSSSYSADVVERPLNEYIQDEYWYGDLAVFIGDINQTWKFSISGVNITDQYWANSAANRVFATLDANGKSDKVLYSNRGRTVTAKFVYNF